MNFEALPRSSTPFALKQSERNSCLLHRGNASAHTSLLVREFLAKNNTQNDAPASPGMSNFLLFPKIKRTLNGRCFSSVDDIKSALLKVLKAIPKIEF